jgi:di/tricarboxylate transporter
MTEAIKLKRIKAITKSYFKLGWKNLPVWMIPVAWIMSPLCILLGYLFLEDFMMGVKESDYKGT